METNVAINQLDPVGSMIGGYNNVLTPYYGPTAQPAHTNPFEKRNRTEWTLADSHANRSQYLADTALDLMFTSMQSWHTEQILPWQETDNIHFTWKKTEYNAHLMRNTPALAASRLMTQRAYTRKASLLRKGIGFVYEHDFYKTPEGRVSFFGYMGQLSRTVQETANNEVINALLHSHAGDDNWLKQNTIITDKTIREYLEKDRERFALAQKSENGLEKLSVEINSELDKYNGMADTFIMPQCMSDYVEFRPEVSEFYRMGLPRTQTVMAPHPLDNPLPQRYVREAGVFMTRSKYVEGVGESDPLGRLRQNGSYNTMRMQEDIDYDDYRTAVRARRVYDEDRDDWRAITLMDAIEHCELFDDKGELRVPKTDRLRGQQDLNALDKDFLVYTFSEKKGDIPKRHAVRYIGDIDKDFLDARTIANCAKSVKAAVKRALTEVGYTDIENTFKSIRTLDTDMWPFFGKDYDGREEEPAAKRQRLATEILSLSKPQRDAFNVMARTLKSILGDRNGMFKDSFNGKRLYENAFLQSVTPVVAYGKEVPKKDLKKLREIETRLIDTLKVVAPTEKKDEIETIASKKAPALEVAEQIYQKMKSYFKAKLKDDNFKFASQKAIDGWYKERVDMYHERVAGVEDVAPAPTNKIAGYMRTGQDLSGTGYKYVYPASAQHIADPIASITSFRMEIDEANSHAQTSQRGVRGAEDSMGFAGISHQSIGDRAGQLNRRRTTYDGKKILAMNNGFGHQIKAVGDLGLSVLDRILAVAYLGVRFDKESLMNLARKDVCVPVDFVFVRPHQQRHTQAIIKMAAKGKSGYTYFAQPSMEIGHDAGTKNSHAHYTMWIRSIVQHPENVYVQQNVYVDGYNGGNGTEFFNPDSYRNIDWEDMSHSIICIAIPVTERRLGDKNGTIDLKGRFGMDYIKDMGQTAGNIDKDGTTRPTIATTSCTGLTSRCAEEPRDPTLRLASAISTLCASPRRSARSTPRTDAGQKPAPTAITGDPTLLAPAAPTSEPARSATSTACALTRFPNKKNHKKKT